MHWLPSRWFRESPTVRNRRRWSAVDQQFVDARFANAFGGKVFISRFVLETPAQSGFIIYDDPPTILGIREVFPAPAYNSEIAL